MNMILLARYRALAERRIVYLFTRGDLFATLEGEARGETMPTHHILASSGAGLDGNAGAYVTELLRTLLIAETQFAGRALPKTQAVEKILMDCRIMTTAVCGGATYGIVWGQGEAAGSKLITEAGARVAKAVHGGGYWCALVDLTGIASPTAQPVERVLMDSSGDHAGEATPKTQTPESVLLASGATANGAAGTEVVLAEHYQPVVQLSIAQGNDEEESTVTLYVDLIDHPLDNTSDPEDIGEDEYTIQIY